MTTTKEVAFVWRGSVTDLVTDIAAVFDVEQLAELSGEVALAWRQKYHAIRTAEARVKADAEALKERIVEHADDCSMALGRHCDCGGRP